MITDLPIATATPSPGAVRMRRRPPPPFDRRPRPRYSPAKREGGDGQFAIAVVLACVLAGGCVPPVAAQQADSRQPGIPPTVNPPISAALTCTEFNLLLHSKTSGFATIWLDGYYSVRAGLTALPAGWVRTVAQGLGGTCAISVNASRPVLDVIAQLHREYGGAMAMSR